MTTTIMRDSIVGDQWIMQTMQACPITRLLNEQGMFEGDIRLGPCRLSYFDDSLFELPKPMQGSTSEPKFGSHLLFPPNTDFTIMYEEYYRLCGIDFPEHFQNGQYYGLQSPFKDQGEKAAKYSGYTPGCVFINSTTKFKPQVCDIRKNIIIDKSRVYPGMWAIPTVRGYPSGKSDPRHKKGIMFGLQSVMIIGDDTKFGGAAPDLNKLYAGMGQIAPPAVRPQQLAGMPQGSAPPPAAGIPGYIAPGGGVQRPGMPQGQPPAPQVSQQHWQQPGTPQGQPPMSAGGFTGVYTPAAPGPVATTANGPCFCGSGKPEIQCCGIPF